MDTQKIFDALPHVNKIWVTSDGHFHLHDHEGGTLFLRPSDDIPKEEIKTSQPKGNKKVK
jgi:hypothetical protein